MDWCITVLFLSSLPTLFDYDSCLRDKHLEGVVFSDQNYKVWMCKIPEKQKGSQEAARTGQHQRTPSVPIP